MNKLNIWNYQKLIQRRNSPLQGRLSCHGQNIWFLSLSASWEKIPFVVHRILRLDRVKIYNMNLVLIDLQIMNIDTFVFKRHNKQSQPQKIIYFLSVGWLEFLISGWPNVFWQFLIISYASVSHLKTNMLRCIDFLLEISSFV